MSFDIRDSILTTRQRVEILEDIDFFMTKMYSLEEIDIKQLLKLSAKFNLWEAVFSSHGNVIDKGKFLTEVEDIKRLIVNMRELKATLAFEPNWQTTELIAKWIKTNIGSDVLVEFKVDPDVLAGCTISFAGRYGDFTLSGKLREFLNLNAENIRKDLGL